MTLPLTVDTIMGAYEYLRTTPPFIGWNLPEPADVEWKVGKTNSCFGWHDYKSKNHKHRIVISSGCIGHTMTLIQTVAHEMIHMHLRESAKERDRIHSKAFKKLSESVARTHGFDPKGF